MSQVPAPEASSRPLELTSERAIALFRWWSRLGTAFNVVMVVALVVALVMGFNRNLGSMPILIAGLIWFGVLIASVKARRLAVDAVPLIAAGEFSQAEDRLSQSLRSFSVIGSTKLLGLQQLAMLRHAQARWSDAAALCEELIARLQGSRRDRSVELPARLMLAESLLEVDDVAGAEVQLTQLAWAKLPLRETLLLTSLRLDLESRSGRWRQMIDHVAPTMTLAELMPAPMSSRCHAMLALAAKHLGKSGLRTLLARRALLLGSTDRLLADRPFLRDAFEPTELPMPAQS